MKMYFPEHLMGSLIVAFWPGDVAVDPPHFGHTHYLHFHRRYPWLPLVTLVIPVEICCSRWALPGRDMKAGAVCAHVCVCVCVCACVFKCVCMSEIQPLPEPSFWRILWWRHWHSSSHTHTFTHTHRQERGTGRRDRGKAVKYETGASKFRYTLA